MQELLLLISIFYPIVMNAKTCINISAVYGFVSSIAILIGYYVVILRIRKIQVFKYTLGFYSPRLPSTNLIRIPIAVIFPVNLAENKDMCILGGRKANKILPT